jgi:hypothetical protein
VQLPNHSPTEVYRTHMYIAQPNHEACCARCSSSSKLASRHPAAYSNPSCGQDHAHPKLSSPIGYMPLYAPLVPAPILPRQPPARARPSRGRPWPRKLKSEKERKRLPCPYAGGAPQPAASARPNPSPPAPRGSLPPPASQPARPDGELAAPRTLPNPGRPKTNLDLESRAARPPGVPPATPGRDRSPAPRIPAESGPVGAGGGGVESEHQPGAITSSSSGTRTNTETKKRESQTPNPIQAPTGGAPAEPCWACGGAAAMAAEIRGRWRASGLAESALPARV